MGDDLWGKTTFDGRRRRLRDLETYKNWDLNFFWNKIFSEPKRMSSESCMQTYKSLAAHLVFSLMVNTHKSWFSFSGTFVYDNGVGPEGHNPSATSPPIIWTGKLIFRSIWASILTQETLKVGQFYQQKKYTKNALILKDQDQDKSEGQFAS